MYLSKVSEIVLTFGSVKWRTDLSDLYGLFTDKILVKMNLKVDVNLCRACLGSELIAVLDDQKDLIQKFQHTTQLTVRTPDNFQCKVNVYPVGVVKKGLKGF